MEGRRGGGEGRIKRKAKKELTRAEDRQRERMREKQRLKENTHSDGERKKGLERKSSWQESRRLA